MSREIKGRVARGAVWMVAMRLSVTLLGFASTVILARLLVPADFGLVALGTALVAALELLTSFRFEVSLIQNQQAGREEYDTAWTLNQLLGLSLALLLCLFAWPAAAFYDDPRLAPIVFALALGALLDGAQNIGIVNFRRNLEFARDFAFTVTRKVVQCVVAGLLAYEFRSYWALAAGILAASLTGLVASYAMESYRPRWSLARARQLFDFSKWLVIDNAMYFLRHRMSTVIIGRFVGPGAVGLFMLAYELATLTHANLTAPIDRALFPGYSRMAGDRALVRSSYLAVAGMTALIAMPLVIGTASAAPSLVPVLFGPQWTESISLVQLLALGSSISLLGSGASAVYLALGQPRILVWLGAVQATVLLGSMTLFVREIGIEGAAWGYIAAACVSLPLQLGILRWAMDLSPALWWRRIWRPVLACAAMHLVIVQLQATAGDLHPGLAGLAQLFGFVLAGGATYVATVLFLWAMAGRPSGAEALAIQQLRKYLGRGAVTG
ncbi:MAG: lipopolysaccharide biosynthesis protein [Gammaproteobacteria bacterium]|nr:lipopolysaccharide biosynthesis protein [Gammaproteobacteria bacterium]